MTNADIHWKVNQITTINGSFDYVKLQAFVNNRPESLRFWLEVCYLRAIEDKPFPYERG